MKNLLILFIFSQLVGCAHSYYGPAQYDPNMLVKMQATMDQANHQVADPTRILHVTWPKGCMGRDTPPEYIQKMDDPIFATKNISALCNKQYQQAAGVQEARVAQTFATIATMNAMYAPIRDSMPVYNGYPNSRALNSGLYAPTAGTITVGIIP